MKKLAIAGVLLASLTALAACDGKSVEAAQEQRMVRVEHTAYGDILIGEYFYCADGKRREKANND